MDEPGAIVEAASVTVRAARVLVTPELLEQWLCLPKGNRIVGVRERFDDYAGIVAGSRAPRYVEFMLAGPDMPELRLGELAPTITPTYRRIEHGLVALDGHP